MISFNRRFNPALAAGRQWLKENAQDRPPRLALGRMLRHDRREADFARDTGIHLVDAVLSFMGEPQKIAATRLAMPTPQAYLFSAHLEFADRAAGTLLIAPVAGADQEIIELYGEDYYVHIDVAAARCNVWDRNRQVLS
jgi:predicted dehydrogenase